MSQLLPVPTTPACAALAPLLSLAARDLPGDLLDAAQSGTVRAHVATCAHCQRELARHARLDDALRQAFAVRADAAPPFTPARLAALIADDAPPVPARPSAIGHFAPRRRLRLPDLAGLPAAAAVLLIAFFAGYLFHQGGRVVTGTSAVTPAFHLPPHTILYGITAISPTEWWAAGLTPDPAHASPTGPIQTTPGAPYPTYIDPVIIHYAGGRFSLATLPSSLLGRTYGVILTGLAMVSPDEGWAIGNTVLPPNADGMTFGVLLHYIGDRWTLANAHLGTQLNAITMRTASDGWIAGQDDANNTLVLHYNGATWTQVNDPALTQLAIRSVAAPAPNDVWMVGYHTDVVPPAAIVHYNGVHWTVENSPYPNTMLSSMAMTSPGEGWALSDIPIEQIPSVPTSIRLVARILHYRNGVWEQQASFTGSKMPPFELSALAMRSASDGWAVGSQGMLIHYTGGQWRQVQSPTISDLYAVTLFGATDGWAVGDSTILRLAGGRWSVV